MKKKFKKVYKFLKEYLLILLIMFGINYAWIGMEILEFGEKTPSVADSVILFVLVTSIILNIKFFKDSVSPEVSINLRGDGIKEFFDVFTNKDEQ